ncbi:MAG: rhamnogalacturonan acetylesterase [Tannerellaceae bacterium]|nr:rhamnogalacturonan acetylesterase [Tannerellaceae bacterium]
MKQSVVCSLLCIGFTTLFAGAQTITPVAAPLEDVNKVIDNTPDSLYIARTARPVPGSSRRGDHPVLFLIGNSTMRTGTKGNGENGQWGWGYFAPEFFDEEKITVENHAMGGTSSRTFYKNLWPEVREGIRPGDWVIIELGHNDNGPYDEGRARASIPGIGKDSLQVVIKETGEQETVYSFGEYMRKYIQEVKERGAHPVLFSLTPRNAWVDADSTVITRVNQTFGLWAKQIAEEQNIPFIDLNEISAQKYERFGKEKVKRMFYLDRIHTSAEGARINAGSAAEGLRQRPDIALSSYLKPVVKDTVTGASRQGNNPVLFTIGDSTVRNEETDEHAMWGWGSVIAPFFDLTKITVENHAMGGRSSRTFIDEGRWQRVYNALQPGDFVLLQFGHNDGGDIHTGKARGTLRGAGKESEVMLMEQTGTFQVIYTYGEYLRHYIQDIREKGATPIVLSHTPRKQWDEEGRIRRNAGSYGGWAREAAETAGAFFIDLNEISAAKFDQMTKEEIEAYFKNDHTHTSLKGAQLNTTSIVEGLQQSNCELKRYLK